MCGCVCVCGCVCGCVRAREYFADVSDPTDDRDWYGYVISVGIFLALLVTTLSENLFFDMVVKSGMKVRSALVGSIYRKALRLSNKARQERSTGCTTWHDTTSLGIASLIN